MPLGSDLRIISGQLPQCGPTHPPHRLQARVHHVPDGSLRAGASPTVTVTHLSIGLTCDPRFGREVGERNEI
ncbi:hypothetical protein AAFF_G00306950 [Aldrovandia affinis]|uniref:Uncharacterized protein n=1 Tax=Aldrovandia affinis TaxID=143900 RepID=A0AAD7W0X0_9TELE|nr:hypothetical protein AAFF_G00306950 [Aldrovandia affinis]